MSFVRKLYTADLHLGHHGILRHCPATRAFEGVEAMDTEIVRRINERIEHNDTLYIVGDFAISGDKEYVSHLFHAIRCRKILVLGNHDLDSKGRVSKTIRDLPWDIPPQQALETTDEGCPVYLHHYGCRVWPRHLKGAYHLFGHSHGALPPMGRSRDVGIDCPDMHFAPATFRELKESLVSVDPAWHQSLVTAFGASVPSLEFFRCRPSLQPTIWQMYADLEASGLLQSVQIIGIETRERGWVTITRRLDPGLSAVDRRACDDLLTAWDMDLSEADRHD
jgi:calcineurin-like phosphoesterase family protein